MRHGAKVKTCTHEGCNNQVRRKGVCAKHGAKKKTCSYDGCTNQAQKGQLSSRAHVECSVEGCNRKAAGNGRCRKEHKGYDLCSQDGCTNKAQMGGVCRSHKEFAIVKEKAAHMTCSVEGWCNRKAAEV